jgi:hypothetical protein
LRATHDLGSGRLDSLDCASGVARGELSILLRRGTVTRQRRPVALARRNIASGCRLDTVPSSSATELSVDIAKVAGDVVRDGVATVCEVLIRCLLIAVGRGLVAVRRGLVEVGLGLVDVRERLLAIGTRLIVVESCRGIAVRRIRRTIAWCSVGHAGPPSG